MKQHVDFGVRNRDKDFLRGAFICHLISASHYSFYALLIHVAQNSQLGPERFRAPEILFQPEVIGLEYPGIHQVVVDSINRADLDLRKNLFANIVLSGGSTLCNGTCIPCGGCGESREISKSRSLSVRDHTKAYFVLAYRYTYTGFGDRLLSEVKKLAVKDIKIKIYAPPERKYSTWIGGSILAALSTFKKVSVLRKLLREGR